MKAACRCSVKMHMQDDMMMMQDDMSNMALCVMVFL